jgi:hypothetical protein
VIQFFFPGDQDLQLGAKSTSEISLSLGNDFNSVMMETEGRRNSGLILRIDTAGSVRRFYYVLSFLYLAVLC